jgi:hypothetical protein
MKMNAKDFEKLLKGVREAGEIVRGERAPAREAVVDSAMVKDLRKSLRLSQPKFAALLTVDRVEDSGGLILPPPTTGCCGGGSPKASALNWNGCAVM